MSVTMAFDEPVHELGKIVDTEELLANFIIDMPRDLTDSEKALKKELISLRKMRRTLTELCQIRKEEKPRAPVKTGEKAKEEAMELLRSGAIQIADKKDRHTFKRKPKEVDDEESISRTFSKPVELEKRAPYSNFLRGPKLMPQCSEVQEAQSVDLKEGKPFRSLDFERDRDGSCTPSSNLELAASKRKQQLLALSEEETEEEEQNVESSIPPESQTDHGSDNMGDSSYSCPSSETTLHVGYHQVTTDFIHEMFEPLGTIVRVKINDYQNHAYVTMATREMAKKALELDHQMVNNRLLRVGFARKQFSRPRRDSRPVRPFSPKFGFGRRFYPPPAYNAVPPNEQATSGPPPSSRNVVTYCDLDYGDV